MVNTAVAQAVEIISTSATYIVTVDGDFNDVVRGQLRDAGITIDDEFEYAFNGFVVELSDYQLPYVQSLEYVEAIEEDGIVTVAATQSPTPSWGIDRIDQRERSASGAIGSYEYQSAGAGTTIYIGDSGIFPHQDLAGRISPSGYTSFNDGRGTIDCNGHGTHVATTAAGTQYGVAKNATVVPINITVTVTISSGNLASAVSSNVQAALDAYLHPDYWAWGSTIYYNELISLIDRVTGVDRVVSLSIVDPDGRYTSVNGDDLDFDYFGCLPNHTTTVTVST
jgi:subtilisin family serine protease